MPAHTVTMAPVFILFFYGWALRIGEGNPLQEYGGGTGPAVWSDTDGLAQLLERQELNIYIYVYIYI